MSTDVKITIIGAGGVRTPLMLKSFLARQERLGLTELALMDIDAEHIELIRALSIPVLEAGDAAFDTLWTTDACEAIQDADYVVTTFRVGGIASRVVDEQVPLRYGVLGQETTGPGGFAMALRTIPPILEYVEQVRVLAPGAWIINFTNPAGLVTEAIINRTGFERTIGICDNPPTMHRAIARFLDAQPDEVFLEYFGLNHLGWVRADGEEPRFFGNGVGIGFDAIVNIESRKIQRLRGFLLYFVALLRTLAVYYAAPRTRLRIDDAEIEGLLMLISIMNGHRIGGGFYTTPDSQMDDGLLDLCVGHKVGRLRMVGFVPQFMTGTHTRDRKVTMMQGQKVTVVSEMPWAAHVDGEIYGVGARHYEIELFPQRLRLLR